MKVLGIKKYDFTSREGEHISGVQMLVVNPSEVESVVGMQWDILKFSIDKYNQISQDLNHVDLLNKEITPIYNRYGRVEQIILVK